MNYILTDKEPKLPLKYFEDILRFRMVLIMKRQSLHSSQTPLPSWVCMPVSTSATMW